MRELVIEEGTNSPVLITEYIENKKGHFKEMYDTLTPETA